MKIIQIEAVVMDNKCYFYGLDSTGDVYLLNQENQAHVWNKLKIVKSKKKKVK